MKSEKSAPERNAERVVDRAFGVKDRRMRTAILGEFLSLLPVDEFLEVVRIIMERSEKKSPRYQEAYFSLIDSEFLLPWLGPEKVDEIINRARETGYHEILRLFSPRHPESEKLVPGDLEVPAGLEYLTLGEKKSLAKGKRTLIWEKLLFDPDPTVIRNVLQNPRMTELEVIRIASRRPVPAAVLRVIFDNHRWIQRYRVKRTLIFNPHTPVDVSRNLLGYMLQPDLEEISQDLSLNLQVREEAVSLLEKKKRKTDQR
ncbi:MAG: hypothetical protein PHE84_11445 [bacterium]|nr:hypothetical protein [bacterium]